jgi:mono/diheme cytochrome c family protein
VIRSWFFRTLLIPAKPAFAIEIPYNLHDMKTNHSHSIFVCIRVISWLIPVALAQASESGPNFSRDVRPILSNHCFKCHGPDEAQRKAELRLDTEAGSRGVTTPDADGVVEMLRRVTAADDGDRMPPPDAKLNLAQEQIATLRGWIEAGAPYEVHWAFQRPVRPALPAVTDAEWPVTPIDRFILARLEAAELTPSPEADAATLLRRVSLDLTGLPPSPEDVARFVADSSPEAYAREVDRLLASPHYGERWARHWLDLARYADSNGYSIDSPRMIWPYRDWVIDAFNADMPFDRFTVEQLAGDLVSNATEAQRIATGFHRNTMINEEGGVDPEEFRLEAVVDRVNTTATVWLGLTMSCAECHTHKYDPITQTEFYRFFAFFNSDDETTIELPAPEQAVERERVREEVRALSRELRDYLTSTRGESQAAWEAALSDEAIGKLDEAVRAGLATPLAERTAEQARAIEDAFKAQDAAYQKRAKEIERVRKSGPPIPSSLILSPRGEPRETRIHLGGDFTRKGDAVTPGVPSILHPLRGEADDRSDLAEWIVDAANPLTARVTVNRVWQRYFGKGLVETENDFGIQGQAPTHPELLDWLAVEFVESGWRMKALHRTIVLSAVYRQASTVRTDLAKADPLNRLLGRQNRIRLDAEIVRDVSLVTAGVLNAEVGGPGVFPPQPDGVMRLGQQNRAWKVSDGADRFRRGMYTYFWRATPHPTLMVFDAPDAMTSCTRRNRSNTPLQALTLLNDAAFFELAQAFAGRVLREALPMDEERIARAIRLAYNREAMAQEVETLRDLLGGQRMSFDRNPERAVMLSDNEWLRDYEAREAAAWTMVARALMNTDEFITRE